MSDTHQPEPPQHGFLEYAAGVVQGAFAMRGIRVYLPDEIGPAHIVRLSLWPSLPPAPVAGFAHNCVHETIQLFAPENRGLSRRTGGALPEFPPAVISFEMRVSLAGFFDDQEDEGTDDSPLDILWVRHLAGWDFPRLTSVLHELRSTIVQAWRTREAEEVLVACSTGCEVCLADPADDIEADVAYPVVLGFKWATNRCLALPICEPDRPQDITLDELVTKTSRALAATLDWCNTHLINPFYARNSGGQSGPG